MQQCIPFPSDSLQIRRQCNRLIDPVQGFDHQTAQVYSFAGRRLENVCKVLRAVRIAKGLSKRVFSMLSPVTESEEQRLKQSLQVGQLRLSCVHLTDDFVGL